MAGGIAHDFNNILAAILGNVELAKRPSLSEDKRLTHLEKVVAACERARDLVRQMFTFARTTPQARRPVELAPIIKEVLSLLRPSLPATIEIRHRLSQGTVVLGDATQMHQIIMNLVTNAGLAMPSGGVLDVELSMIDVDLAFSAQHVGLRCGPAARIIVRDSGVGMTRAVQARMFEPFFTTRVQGQGTGLGLAVVHGIVRDGGGAITVHSEVGIGTEFSVILPLTDGTGSGTTRKISNRLPSGQQQRILFVDDEAGICEVAHEMLTTLNYRIDVARDGLEALALIRAEPSAYDLLITDATMPHLSGPELITSARALVPRLPVILCSGQSEVGRTLTAGDIRFLAKPITMAELATAISEVLRADATT